jgi:hypothetical protein
MPQLYSSNAEKTFLLAKALFPQEEWVFYETGIFIAKNRMGKNYKEQIKLYKEISDVRILTSRGSVAFFLPETSEKTNNKKRYADTVLDGAILEIKTISGNRTTLGKSFKKGYKQGLSVLENYPHVKAEHNVFLRIFTPFTIESVRAKIAGEIKNTTDDGYCICYFETTKELYYWTYDELRKIIGT